MEIKETVAAILVETGKPLLVDTIKLPDSLEPGQVLVELITSGICGAQINEIDAVKGPDKFLPHLLGHEGYAKVVETGPGVFKVKKEDYVVLHWRPSSGIQAQTAKYKFGSMEVNAGWVTSFNKHAVVSENRVTKVSSNHDKYLMPLLGCALTTAHGVLKNEAQLSQNDNLLIMGLGGVGSAILLFAKYYGAKHITVVDKDERKKTLAFKLGADEFVSYTDKVNTSIQLNKVFTKIGKPEVVIETSGNTKSIEISYENSSDQGRIILVGVPRLGEKVLLYTLPLHFGKKLTGSKGGGSVPDIDIPLILNLFNTKNFNVQNLSTEVRQFSNINEAISELREGVNGRIVLEF